jgi:uncharacterized membrane protein
MQKEGDTMKVKGRNLSEMILQIVSIVLLFMPFMYMEERYERTSGLGGMTRTRASQVSFADVTLLDTSDIWMVLGIILIAVMVLCLGLYIVQYVGKGAKQNSKAAAIISVVELLAFIAIAGGKPAGLFEKRGETFSYGYVCSVVFFLEFAVVLALTLLTMIGYVKVKKLGIKEKDKPVIVNNISSANELKTYKELLDSGVITQEEFDAKKSELLGM